MIRKNRLAADSWNMKTTHVYQKNTNHTDSYVFTTVLNGIFIDKDSASHFKVTVT